MSPSNQRLKNILPILYSVLGVIFSGLILTYHFFINIKCPIYPWWHQFDNDICSTYVAQSLALLNGGELVFIDHPGGAVYTLFGLFFRILGSLTPAYSGVLHLSQLGTPERISALLDLALPVARIFNFVLMIFLLMTLTWLLVKLSRRPVIAFFIGFFFISSFGAWQHFSKIRPEKINILFAALALGVALSFKNHGRFGWLGLLGKGVFLGTCLGLSLLAKIQALPLVVAVFGYSVIAAWQQNKTNFRFSRWIDAGFLLLAIANILLFPWWSVRRPEIVTDAYLARFPVGYDRVRVYGLVPDSLTILFWPTLLILIGIAAGMFFLSPTKYVRIKRAVAVIQSVISGGILSIYLVLLPVSTSLKSYIANTNNLFYALLTNIKYGAFIQHKITDFHTPRNIFSLHIGMSQLCGINLLYFVFLATLVCLGRIFMLRGQGGGAYAGVLVFFAMGVFMDAICALRMPADSIVGYYAIYSSFLHSLGLGLWAGLEWTQARWRLGPVTFRTFFIFIFAVHLVGRLVYYRDYPKATGISDQNPRQEFINTLTHAEPFWRIATNDQLNSLPRNLQRFKLWRESAPLRSP